MSSQDVDFYRPQPEVDAVKQYLGTQEVFRSSDEIDRAMEAAKGKSRTPDGVLDKAFKYLGYPSQLAAATLAKLVAPDYVARDFSFSMPESSHDQRTFPDLLLGLSGKTRGDVMRDAGATGAMGLGVGLDIFLDPTLLLSAPFKLTQQAALLKRGLETFHAAKLATATRDAVTGLGQAIHAGAELHNAEGLLTGMREALQAGQDVFPISKALLDGVAKGDRAAINTKNALEKANQELKALEHTGYLSTTDAVEQTRGLIEQALGQRVLGPFEKVSMGAARLLPLGGQPTRLERAAARGVQWATSPLVSARDKLLKAMGAAQGGSAFQYAAKQVEAQGFIDAKATLQMAQEHYAQIGQALGREPTRDELKEAIDLIEKPISENVHQFAAAQKLRAFIDSPRFDQLSLKAAAKGKDNLYQLSRFGVDESYYSFRGLKSDETKDVLATGSVGEVSLSPGRAYVVTPLTDEQAMAAKAMYLDVKGLPGFGQAGVTGDRAVVRRLLGAPLPPDQVTVQHVDQLERVLSLTAKKGNWGLAEGAQLENAFSLGSGGVVQLTNPTAMVQYGSFEEALAASHAGVSDFLGRVAPRTQTSLPLLSDATLAAKVKPDTARRALLYAAESWLERASPQEAKSRRIWDRGVLESGIDNPRQFPEPVLKGVAAEITRNGHFPPIRIAVDPNTGRVVVADEASSKLLEAARYMERADVPVQRVSWVGDVFEPLKKGSEVRATEAELRQVYSRLESIAQQDHGLVGEDAVRMLRTYGLSDGALQALTTTRFLDDAGNEIMSLRSLAAQLQKDGARARVAVDVALGQARMDILQREAILEQAFRQVGIGYDVDRKVLFDLVKTLPPDAAQRVQRALMPLAKKVDTAEAFIKEFNPLLLGAERAYAVRPVNGTLHIAPLGAASPDYAASGLNAAGRFAQRENLHPLTQMQVARHPADPGLVRGVEQPLPLAALGSRPTKESALARLDQEELKAALTHARSYFVIDPERRAKLAEDGITFNPRGFFKDRVIPDTEVHTFVVTPGRTWVYGHGIGETEVIKQKVWEQIPAATQEFGRADQSAIHIHNLQFGMMEGLHKPNIALLNDRLKGLAQDLLKQGHHGNKDMVFADYIAMDPTVRDMIFGEKIPTIKQVASGDYKVVIPAGWEGRAVEVANPLSGAVYTVRAASSSGIQKIVDMHRELMGGIATNEILNKLMLPSSVRYGYFARLLSPEGRRAMDAWFTAVAHEKANGIGGKLYSVMNQHYKKRTLAQLSTAEINDLFDSGKLTLANGKTVTREDLLTVKTADGKTLADALKDDPEALSFFVTEVRDSQLVRIMAGKRSIRNAQFIDAVKSFATPVLDGRTEVPLKEARALVERYKAGETLSAQETELVKLLTQKGIYQATITRQEAQRLVAEGQLDLDMLKPLEGGDAMLAVEGRIFEHPRWKDGMVRFMPREALAEINKTYARLTSLPSLNALTSGYHALLGMWKRQALFLSPKFYTRNVVGNILLAWQGGLHPLDVGTHAEAFNAIRGYKQYTRFSEGSLEAGDLVLRTGGHADVGIHPLKEITNAAGETRTYEQLIEVANANNVFHGTYARQLRKELNDTLAGRGISALNDMPLNVPFNGKANWGKPIEGVIEKGIKLHEGVENQFRFAVFLRNWKDGKTPAEAASIATRVLGGSMAELTPMERTIGVGLLPFYQWLRFNIPRQAMWHIERPDQALRMWRAVDIIGRGGADVPEEELPAWAKKHFNLVFGKNKEGQWGFLTLDSFLPAADLLRLRNLGTEPGEFTSDTVMQSLTPFIRTPLEGMMNRTLEGRRLEAIPGELSDLAFGPVPLPGMTRRATTAGPLAHGNLLWNEQVFNLFRPAKELSQLLGLFHKPEQELGERIRNFMLVKVTDSDPLKQSILHNHERQQVFRELRSKYRAAVKEGNETKQRYWRGQINAHVIWEDK